MTDLSQLTVPLLKTVSSSSIESSLRNFYQKSRRSNKTHIVFDFEHCDWCELFGLSLISLWIWELNTLGKKISVICPANPVVDGFFVSYRFKEFLNTLSVEVRRNNIQGTYPRAREAIAPSYPLTFLSSEVSLRDLLTDLKDPKRLAVLLAGMDDTEIVSRGALRNVVLKELGDNIFYHGDGKAGHLMMTKISKLQVKKPRRKTDISGHRVFESIQGLADKPVLEIVISDKGPGIPDSLRSTYIQTKGIADTKTVSDCDVVEYAFQYFTSRRSIEERLGEFLKHFIEGSSPPPTGLYQLRQLVRDYDGILCVRTGRVFVAFDFSSRNQAKTIRSDSPKLSEPLSDFGGTQYRILIPVEGKNKIEQKINLKSLGEAFAFVPTAEQEFFSVNEFMDVAQYGDMKIEGKGVFSLFEAIDGSGLGNSVHARSVVIDFESAEDISSKSLYAILVGLCRRQLPERLLLAINVSPNAFSSFQDGKPEDLRRNRNVLVFDDNAVPYLFGLLREDGRLVKCSVTLPAEESAVLSAIPREAVRRRVEKHVFSPEAKIFQENAKVLLLSDGYSLGYFEISRLFQDHQARSRTVRWIVYQLMELEPEVVVSLGAALGGLVSMAIDTFAKKATGAKVQHINLRTDIRGGISVPKLLLIDPGTKVLVVGDVVGTSRSMAATLRKLRHTAVQRVIAIVDAQVEEIYADPRYPRLEVASIVHKPLRYFYELPPEWRYHEIFQVDPNTHGLIKEIVKPRGPIWIEHPIGTGTAGQMHSGFLEDIVLPERAYFFGHFVTGKKHMTYLFDIATIADNHEAEIVTSIQEDIRKAEETRRKSEQKPIARVLFPQFTH